MANKDQLAILKSGIDNWNMWREQNQNIYVDLRNATLKHANLTKANLKGADLKDSDLRHANLELSDISEAHLSRADLRFSNLSGANLTNTYLNGANLNGTLFINNKLTNSKWHYAQITILTTICNPIYDHVKHDALSDGTDTILFFTTKHKRIQWSFIRNIGRFPLFGISWTGLITTLLIINMIGWWNTELSQTINALNDTNINTIVVPSRLLWSLFGTSLLAIASAMYTFLCPERVKEFSEVQWVEQLGRPRLMYLSESLGRSQNEWMIICATLLLYTLGCLVALGLVIDSLLMAFGYIVPELLRLFYKFLNSIKEMFN